jgi:ABC-2 type transport system ATP-binding protein
MREAATKQLAVRVAGLEKRYGRVQALSRIDLEIPRGEAFGLVGANGAGKTTLIKCLLDLCGRDGGTVELFGIDARRTEARRSLAYVPERFVPPHYLRGREFIELMQRLCGRPADDARVGAVLASLELARDALARPVRQFSKGMTQKLGLAACLAMERDLYVLDEPMSGLDPVARIAVKDLLRTMLETGKTLFFTSHVLSDVEELCTSIAVLDRGRVRFRGTPAALRERYAESNLEKAFMKCIRDEQPAALA